MKYLRTAGLSAQIGTQFSGMQLLSVNDKPTCKVTLWLQQESIRKM